MMFADKLRSDDGAVAIMYSILMLVFIGFVAIALDIGAMRADRRNTQLLADNAATSGGTFLLEEFDGSPTDACDAAWEYFLLNAPEVDPTGPWDNPCDGITWTCETAPAYVPDDDTGPWVVGEAGPYEAVIVWPVPDELIAGEGYSEELDGDPCERLGVWIRRTRGFIFGGIFAEGATVGSPAVARVSVGEESDEVASLVILDPVGCKALDVQGQGVAAVLETDDGPGIIAVDSDGSKETTPNDRKCTHGSGQVVIHADDNSAGNCPGSAQIKAGLTDASFQAWQANAGPCSFDIGSGIITAKAMAGAFSDRTFEQADVDADRLAPRPVAGDRITRTLVDHEYNCKDSYTFSMPYALQPAGDPWACENAYDPSAPDVAAVPPYIDHLRDVVGTTGPPGETSPAPSEPTSSPVYPDYSNRPLFGEYEGVPFESYNAHVTTTYGIADPCQTQPSTPPITLPPGNWWVECDALVINNEMTFERGNIVTNGRIHVGGGSLTVNGTNDARSDGLLYIRNGEFSKGAQSQVTLNRTFVYLHNGWIDFGAGDAPFVWNAPDDSEYPAPLSYPFDDLNLWSEHSADHFLGGQASIGIEGILFMPRAKFIYSGETRQFQDKAQFITWRMNVTGQGKLIMRPDPNRNLPIPILQVRLIR